MSENDLAKSAQEMGMHVRDVSEWTDGEHLERVCETLSIVPTWDALHTAVDIWIHDHLSLKYAVEDYLRGVWNGIDDKQLAIQFMTLAKLVGLSKDLNVKDV